mmetsp:Transcript_17165/g.31114  ORF Transcript_17165/g.31114 Transcript_17165/m.31114 type:complete len:207 (+) Transcript_17165:393-1013(+)
MPCIFSSWCSFRIFQYRPCCSFCMASSWACRWLYLFCVRDGITSGGSSSTSPSGCQCFTSSFPCTPFGIWMTSRGVRLVPLEAVPPRTLPLRKRMRMILSTRRNGCTTNRRNGVRTLTQVVIMTKAPTTRVRAGTVAGAVAGARIAVVGAGLVAGAMAAGVRGRTIRGHTIAVAVVARTVLVMIRARGQAHVRLGGLGDRILLIPG